MSAVHVVETLHWDVAFASEDEAFEWQPRLASLLRGRAVALINEVFDEMAARGEVFALDTLEIDLGRLPRDGMEQALQDRLRGRLRDALQALRADARTSDAPQATVQASADREAALLRHYLARGFLPWQAGEGMQRRLAELADAATTQGASELAAWLRGAPRTATARLAQLLHPRLVMARERVEAALLAQSPLTADAREGWMQLALCDRATLVDLVAQHGQATRVRRRMARDFASSMLLAFVGLVVPTERDFIAGVIAQAALFGSALQPPLPATHMKPRLWEFTLAYLLVDRGSEFNRRAYIASLLRRSAQHEGIDESRLLRSLVRALEAAGAGLLRRQMLGLLRSIAHEDDIRAERRRRHEAASRLCIAHHDGDRERIASALRADMPVDDALRAAWTRSADRDWAWFATEVARQGQSARVRHRMARDFGDAMLLRLVRALVPAEHDFIAGVTSEAAAFAQAAQPPVPEPRMRTRLWEFTLAYLLVQRGSEFNRRSYIAGLTRRWAAQDGSDPRALLRSIIASLSHAPAGATRRQMIALLVDLQGESTSPVMESARPGSRRWRDLALPGLRFACRAALVAGDWRESDEAWDMLIAHDADWLRGQARGALQAPRVRERLTARDAGRLAQLVELFAPGNGEFVEALIEEAAPRVRPDVPAAARARLWDFTLAFLTEDRGTEFNRRSYLAALLARMAQDEGVAYRELLAALHAGLQAMAPASGVQRQLLQLTRSLLAECEPSAANDPVDPGDVLEQVLGSPQSGHQLAARLPARLVTRLVHALRPREHHAIERAAQQLLAASVALRVAPSARLEMLQREFMIHYLFVEGRRFDAADFARRFADWLEQKLRIRDAGWRASLAAELRKSPREAGQGLGRLMAAGMRKPTAPRARGSVGASEQPRGAEPQAGEPIYVANAGMVLAQPFLPHLFTMRGLTQDGKFRDAAAAARGVALLQFLVTGQGGFAEHEVVLNKLLCGLPVADPLAWQGELDGDDRAAVASLLGAMAQQWKGLGTTSPQGLRETFLRREGRLLLKGDAWQLLVQPGPYDMLIDTIPWGFSMVKYPWMERMLHVQWR